MLSRQQFPRLAFVLVALAVPLPSAHAQSLGDLRDEIRASLHEARFGVAIAGLVDLSEESELSAARYDIDDPGSTTIRVISLPYRHLWPIDGSERQLYFEGGVGYLTGDSRQDDAFGGGAPGDETGYDSRWTAASGYAGVGLQFPVAPSFTLTPILDLSLTYIENDTSYHGSGAGEAAALLDGLLFNWNGTILGVGGALRADHTGDLSESIQYDLVGRYDLRHLETLNSTDEVQEFSVLSQFLTLRAEFAGPTGWTFGQSGLDWRSHLGYRSFLDETGDALGFTNFVELGGALELKDVLSLSTISLSASVLQGDGVTGWTLGLSGSF